MTAWAFPDSFCEIHIRFIFGKTHFVWFMIYFFKLLPHGSSRCNYFRLDNGYQHPSNVPYIYQQQKKRKSKTHECECSWRQYEHKYDPPSEVLMCGHRQAVSRRSLIVPGATSVI